MVQAWGAQKLVNVIFYKFFDVRFEKYDMSYPYCYQGPTCQLEPFFTMKCKNQLALACPIVKIGASACPMAAFSGFYENHDTPPQGDARGIVPMHHDDHQNSQQSGYILHHLFVDCRPGGHQGDTEQVVA